MSAKSGAAATLIVAVTVFVVPDAGVKVKVAMYVPGATLLAACTANVVGAGPLGGVNVMPAGAVAETVTADVKHVLGAIDADIDWPPPPAVRLTVVGFTDGV